MALIIYLILTINKAECPFEVMELWKLLREGKPHHIKKICWIAKIIIG